MAGPSEFLISGVILGLAQGTSPGPLITLVVSETLKFGKEEGIKVAISPLITDSTIVVLVLLTLSSLAKYTLIIGGVSLFGACYLIFLGLENLRAKVGGFETAVLKKDALKRGIVANFLSPHPYLFWFSIGGPMILESLDVHFLATVLFLLGFYSFLIGSKISVALIVDRSRSFIRSKHYSYVIRVLGVALIFFAAILVIDGVRLIMTR
jgi:threonine/homoserine/homoserine lactone efflux protein